MKVFCKIFSLLLICLISANHNFSQDKNKTQNPVKIRANLMVTNSNDQLADVKPEDLKIVEDGIEQKNAKLTKNESFNLGLVIDSSGSMRTQFDTILGTANLIIENMREKDEAFAVSFISSDNIRLAQSWTSDKNLLKRGINNMFVQGGQSAVVDALMTSAEELIKKKNENERSALILISDCEDRNSFYKTEEVLKKLKDNNIEVYVIGFTQELDGYIVSTGRPTRLMASDFAKLLANETGGAAYFPKYSKKKQDEIIEAAKAIVFELRSQYVIEYVSTNSNPKNKERKFSVEIKNAPNGEKLSAFVRPTINIGKQE